MVVQMTATLDTSHTCKVLVNNEIGQGQLN